MYTKNKNDLIIILVVIVFAILVSIGLPIMATRIMDGDGPSPQPTTVIVSSTPTITNTSSPTKTPEPTFTFTISTTSTITPTPSLSPTPTITPTPTPTATPFGTSGCVNLKSHPDYWNLWHENSITGDEAEKSIQAYYDSFDGKCVKFFAWNWTRVVTTDYLISLSRASLCIDNFTPRDVADATQMHSSSYVDDYRVANNYSTAWGIWNVIESGEYEVLLRRLAPFSTHQQPIIDDGIYNVGSESEIIPGQWKSIIPSEDCYWARINPSTGNIKQNHYGVGGIYVRLYEGDLFKSKDCAPWVFVQP